MSICLYRRILDSSHSNARFVHQASISSTFADDSFGGLSHAAVGPDSVPVFACCCTAAPWMGPEESCCRTDVGAAYYQGCFPCTRIDRFRSDEDALHAANAF
jgi:hypothetical protein